MYQIHRNLIADEWESTSMHVNQNRRILFNSGRHAFHANLSWQHKGHSQKESPKCYIKLHPSIPYAFMLIPGDDAISNQLPTSKDFDPQLTHVSQYLLPLFWWLGGDDTIYPRALG